MLRRVNTALLAVALVAGPALILGTLAPAAQAGTFQVQVGEAYSGSMCGLATLLPGWSDADNECAGQGLSLGHAGTSQVSGRSYWNIAAPAGLTITDANASGVLIQDGSDWSAGSFWQGSGGAGTYGGAGWDGAGGPESSGAISSPYFAFQLICDGSTCSDGASVIVPSLTLTVQENQAPSLIAAGANNLYYQQTGWVWNAPSDPWSLALTGGDPSGVCEFQATVSGPAGSQNPVATQPVNGSVFQQCPEWTWSPTVDTETDVPTSGQLSLAVSDTNAAQVTSSATATINVDNVQPTVTITQLNDNDPTGSGDNADAELEVTPTAGPSGISSVTCTVDGQSGTLTPDSSAAGSYLLDVSDSSSHAVSCTAANAAVNPQGQHNSGTATYTVPAYDTSAVSFKKIADPLEKRRVKERVRVDYHYVTKREKNGKKIRVKAGGHYVTKTVTRYVEHCSTRSVKVKVKGTTRYEKKQVCLKPKVVYPDSLLIKHGTKTTIYGELTSAQGTPLAGQTVEIQTTPDNGSGPATIVGSATTDAQGGWSMAIPAGPSRMITAQYAGDAMQLPSSATATLTVPAHIDIKVSTTKLPWSHILIISGKLVGGYVPSDGVAMRLLFKLPGRKEPYSPVAFRTTPGGTFSVKWTWGTGSGAATYPVSVAMTASESDYPFKAATSRAIPVEFGAATPRPRQPRAPRA